MKKFQTCTYLLISAIIISCEKDPDLKPRDYTYVVTLEVKENNQSGVTLTGDIYHIAGDILEYGFVLNMSGEPTIDDYIVAKNGKPDKGEFTQRISAGLVERNVYFVRAFVRSDQQLVYGNQIDFRSEGTPLPEIQSFSPLSGRAGDEITITGRNFCPYVPWNKLFFDNHRATILSATETRLVVVVPEITETREVTLSILYGYMTITAPTKFENLYP